MSIVQASARSSISNEGDLVLSFHVRQRGEVATTVEVWIFEVMKSTPACLLMSGNCVMFRRSEIRRNKLLRETSGHALGPAYLHMMLRSTAGVVPFAHADLTPVFAFGEPCEPLQLHNPHFKRGRGAGGRAARRAG